MNMTQIALSSVVALLTLLAPGALAAAEGGPSPAPPVQAAVAAAPDFGPNVLIFDPSMTDIQAKIDAVYNRMGRVEFGTERCAYLFKPGKYNLDVQVGFYMHVAGLGASPDDVDITGAVR
jgi:hypothetical protein